MEVTSDGTIVELVDTAGLSYTSPLSVINNSSLYYGVISVNPSGQSVFSNIVSIPTDSSSISPPSRLRVAAVNLTAVTLTFSPPATSSLIEVTPHCYRSCDLYCLSPLGLCVSSVYTVQTGERNGVHN